jgi:integrase
MGRKASFRISRPHPSPRFRDKVRLFTHKTGPDDDVWYAEFLIGGAWTPRNGVSLRTRDFDEACEVARDKFNVADTGQPVTRRYAKADAPKAALIKNAFHIYAEQAIAKLRQRATEADAVVRGKGHTFHDLARRIERDLIPVWSATDITKLTEHALNDWIADHYRVTDTPTNIAASDGQSKGEGRSKVLKRPSVTTLGNLDWAFRHVWMEAVAARVVDRRQRPMIDKGLGEVGEPRAFIDAAGVQAVAKVMTDEWAAWNGRHDPAAKRMLRTYIAMITSTGIRPGLEAMRVLIGHVQFVEQKGHPVIFIRVTRNQGKHPMPRSVVVYEGDRMFDIRRLLIDHIAWRRSQGAADQDYMFAKPDGSFPQFRNALDGALTKAGALTDPMTGEKRVAYSFRHYFATRLVELGLSVPQIADWLGTSSAMVENHYNRFLTERNAHLVNGRFNPAWVQTVREMPIPRDPWDAYGDQDLEGPA